MAAAPGEAAKNPKEERVDTAHSPLVEPAQPQVFLAQQEQPRPRPVKPTVAGKYQLFKVAEQELSVLQAWLLLERQSV